NNFTGLCWYNKNRANPYEEVKSVRTYWQQPESIKLSWKAPDGIFWICGKRAYNTLPKRWRRTCTLGIIQPAFFTLPKEKGNRVLGVPL
ncbi:ENR1 protein, partial [Leucopsar rothschildi]|nr:ENR1 protein [Leucopsar rothschildi]